MIYRFDDHTVDSDARTVKRGDVVLALTPKVFETLLVLIENHDHVMTKDELLSTIWRETIVEEANLTQNISVLRKALGEARSGTKYIGTFPGRGYRFLEPVSTSEEAGTSSVAAPDEDSSTPAAPVNLPASLNGGVQRPKESAPASPRRPYLVPALFVLALAILASAVIVSRSRRIQEGGADPGRAVEIQTLSRMEGAQYQPAWSRDGGELAFVYSAAGDSQSGIYVLEKGGFRPQRVAYGTGEYSSPVWSPNGKRLAFLHLEPGMAEIVIFDLVHSTSRRLAALFPRHYGLSCRHLDWSPDGTVLVVDDKGVSDDPLSLYLVYVDNGNKVRLTYPDLNIIGDVSPRFSPDGSEVAFIRMKYQYQYDIFVVPVTGGVASKVTPQPLVIGDVGWETNHGLIYSARRDREFRLWRQELRSPLPPPVLASSLSTSMPFQFSYLRRDREIAFSAYRPDLDIWALNLSKKSLSEADWTPVIRSPGQDIVPSFSPDGTKIAFRSDVSGKQQIWVSRTDGSGAFPIDTGKMIPTVNCWAPGGDSIVFAAESVSGLYGASLSRKSSLRQISSINASQPLYSVDGRWIFARTGNFLYRIPTRGGSAERITDQGGSPLAQSKDGRYLYFGHSRMDTKISRLDLSTHQQEVVLHTLIPGYRDAWTLSPAGIIFLTEKSGQPVIALHEFATGKERILSKFFGPLPPIGTSGFSLSPDGRTLLVVRADPISANIEAVTLDPTGSGK